MKSLQKVENSDFPFSWVNIDYYPDSMGKKKEIYLINNKEVLDDLILLFYSLFTSVKENLKIYSPSWWDYCLDTWDPIKDEYNYTLNGKSKETIEYLSLLYDSCIDIGYSGSCVCLNWDKFLYIMLLCLVNHKAPYSPIFYDKENNFFFYFHDSGSIGFYYKELNETVNLILRKANNEYEVRESC